MTNDHFASLWILLLLMTPFRFHFSTFSKTTLLKIVCRTENTGRINPWRCMAISIHLSRYLTKATQHISLPWALLRGFRGDKDKQWLEKQNMAFFFHLRFQSKCMYSKLQLQDQTQQPYNDGNTSRSFFFIFPIWNEINKSVVYLE